MNIMNSCTINGNKSQHYLFTIRDYLLTHNIPYNPDDFTALNERKQGKVFNVNEHIKALVYSLLSARVPWVRIVPHLNQLNMLFRGYDPDFIKSMPGDYFSDGIFSLNCGSQCTRAQMNVLAKNVDMLQKLDRQYNGIDNYVTSAPAIEIANDLSKPSSPHKLHQIGPALAWEYLRNVGIDGAKPDVHMTRFLGADRMGKGINAPATDKEVWEQVNEISRETGLSLYAIDALIWEFCAAGYAEICTEVPKCSQCPIRNFCKKGSNSVKIATTKKEVTVTHADTAISKVAPDMDSSQIVERLVAYAKSRGLKFRAINLKDSSPYAVLNGKSSIGYRKKMALTPGSRKTTDVNKIVIFCTDEDKERIESVMHKKDLGNLKDKDRPSCFLFEAEEFPEAVTLLLKNKKNRA